MTNQLSLIPHGPIEKPSGLADFQKNYSINSIIHKLDLLNKIFQKLDVKDIGNLSLTCRSFRNLTNDDNFWRTLVFRDFGEEAASKIPYGGSKKSYKIYYTKLKELLKSLLYPDLLLSQTSGNSVDNGISFYRNFDNYINSMTKNELHNVVKNCATFGFLPLMRAILSHARFIPQNVEEQNNDLDRLTESFDMAAEGGHVEVMRLLMSIPGFYKSIYSNGFCSLASAFRAAAVNGHVKVMELLMKCDRFDEIEVNYREPEALDDNMDETVRVSLIRQEDGVENFRGLGAAFTGAASHGQIDAMKLIMSCSKFRDIDGGDVWGIGAALRDAAADGCVEAIRLIMNDSICLEKIEETDDEDLGLFEVFYRAANKGQVEVIKLLVTYPYFFGRLIESLEIFFRVAEAGGHVEAKNLLMNYFHEMTDEELDLAFEDAAERGCVEKMKFLMSHPDFFKRRSIDALFEIAAERGQAQVINLLMNHQRFPEMNVERLGKAFKLAAERGNVEVMNLIMFDPRSRFDQINIHGENGISKAFEGAVRNEQIEAMNLIRVHPRFLEFSVIY